MRLRPDVRSLPLACRGSAGYYFNFSYNDTQALEYL